MVKLTPSTFVSTMLIFVLILLVLWMVYLSDVVIAAALVCAPTGASTMRSLGPAKNAIGLIARDVTPVWVLRQMMLMILPLVYAPLGAPTMQNRRGTRNAIGSIARDVAPVVHVLIGALETVNRGRPNAIGSIATLVLTALRNTSFRAILLATRSSKNSHPFQVTFYTFIA